MTTSPKALEAGFGWTEPTVEGKSSSMIDGNGCYVNPVFVGGVVGDDENQLRRRKQTASDSYSLNGSLSSDDLRSNKSTSMFCNPHTRMSVCRRL